MASSPSQLEQGQARLHDALASYSPHASNRNPSSTPATDRQNHDLRLLYTPSSIHSTDSSIGSTIKPVSLLAEGVPDIYAGHTSGDILAALTSHSAKMLSAATQFSSLPDQDRKMDGHDSEQIAEAIRKYVQDHHGQSWPSDLELADNVATDTENQANVLAATATNVPTSSALLSGSTVLAATQSATVVAFSFANLLQALEWARMIYTIVWIIPGSLLVLYGYSSFYWLNRLGSRNERIDETSTKRRARSKRLGARLVGSLSSGPALGSGVGGACVGFLFFSFLSSMLACAICSNQPRSLSPQSFFGIWLSTGLMGAFVGGHFRMVGQVLSGLLAGPSLTIFLTAMFGIRTIIIRAVLLCVSTSVLTAPLVVPKRSVIHFHVLNLCTSLVGMLSLLLGVALYAPPQASSKAWIDLLALLFAKDGSETQTQAVKKWGTSSFKGYIAGAALGTAAGFAFELLLHSKAAEDPEEEWNEYLGAYTKRFESLGGGAGGYANVVNGGAEASRAGSFQPPPGMLERIGNLLSTSSNSRPPASYGDVAGKGSRLTERPGGARRGPKKAKRSRRAAPARFEALSKKDLEKGEEDDQLFESDSEATECESGDHEQPGIKSSKTGRIGKGMVGKEGEKELEEEDEDEEGSDLLSPLAKLASGAGCATTTTTTTGTGTENYRGYNLPRPPSYRTDSQGALSSLSGSTARSPSSSSSSSASDPKVVVVVEKPVTVYKDRETTTAGGDERVGKRADGGDPAVPATPSLIMAINRIEMAKAQARAWQEEAKARNAVEESGQGGKGKEEKGFNTWWNKEVGGG
ncbi:hypothetical protein IE53DRAFT_391210 [Violaceomyces palustris]|uniref:Uncharacterized protein n=1 Tax=Violaceomyces palustris TaxID=1673888 RepID=A0ACD0NLE8_9BASI|nr:hypothetical protein IE53DRAFT_391210 [Violaceomyces palustris]